MQSLPLKELDFGLQKRTGPSSGVVASIVLVSPGLDCPGVSLVEVCGTCPRCHCGSLVIEVQYFKTFFYELQKNFKTMRNAYFLCSKQTFYIIRMPISCSTTRALLFSSTHHYIFFYGYKSQ